MQQRTAPSLDRRRFLGAGLGLAAAALWPGREALAAPRLLLRDTSTAKEEGPCLVLVQLTGGNDGLDTLVPYADDGYYRARPNLALPAGRVLRLDGELGLHPNLERLHGEFQEGRLAVVPGVGYPNPNRSHFMSFEVWHTGRAQGRSSGPGWIGRLMDALYGEASAASRVVHVGGAAPYSLHSARHPALALAHPRVYRFAGEVAGEVASDAAEDAERGEQVHCEAAPPGSGMAERLAFLRGVRRDAEASSAEVREAVARHRSRAEYPAEPFARSLATAAALITGRIGARVLSVELGGFDTHVDQRRRHDQLMARLDAGLGAFLRELRGLPEARDTLVLVFSEFGRRVAENGSRGTDHGTAGPMFVAGPRAKGGLLGRQPALTELEGGDLLHTTDFRAVYGSAARALFGVRSEQLFERSYPELPIA